MAKVTRTISTKISESELKVAVRTYLKLPANTDVTINVTTQTRGYGMSEYEETVCTGATAVQTVEEEI